jgi:cell division protein FtsW (lipid II flippase)
LSASLGERLLVPVLITAIFAFLSFAFMFLVRGATRRMRVVGLCSILFILGTLYCMAWHEQLAAITGWENAWIGAAVLVAGGTIALGRALLSRQSQQDRSNDES